MGQFSFYTQDTNRRIENCKEFDVYLVDNKGHKYKEDCYCGYGEFGGKDFFELTARMNGCKAQTKEELRGMGIKLYYHQDEHPGAIFPSITENGRYMDGKAPERDPEQGFPVNLFLVPTPVELLAGIKGIDVYLPINEEFREQNKYNIRFYTDIMNIEIQTSHICFDTDFDRYILETVGEKEIVLVNSHGGKIIKPRCLDLLVSNEKTVHIYTGADEEGILMGCAECLDLFLLPDESKECPRCHRHHETFVKEPTRHNIVSLRELGYVCIPHL